MSEHISGLMNDSMKGLRDLIDVDSIIGKPITTPDGTTIIPVSKVSFGFGGGGTDQFPASQKDLFGGGGGAGVTIYPLCFLIVKDGDVKIANVSENKTTSDRIINMIPDVVDKVSSIINTNKFEKPDQPSSQI